MNTLQELKNYLDEKNLVNTYYWTGDTALFNTFTTSSGMNAQNSFQTLSLDAKWWIDYVVDANEFVLNVSYFTHSGIGVTRDEFIDAMSLNYPAAKYQEQNKLRWIQDENGVYCYQTPTIIVLNLPSANIHRKHI